MTKFERIEISASERQGLEERKWVSRAHFAKHAEWNCCTYHWAR
jgi:hypothetical protein